VAPDTFVAMKDRTLFWASLVMIAAVGMGAFGAHALKGRIDPPAMVQWEKGVLYQLVHGLALFGLAAFGQRLQLRVLRLTRTLFLAGILAFSGSLYFLATRDLLGTHHLTTFLGPLTPLGGLCFMGGWVALLFTALKDR
jgi:uncharacterized membrane protein YgdD (TMEM256/DUF423 family)